MPNPDAPEPRAERELHDEAEPSPYLRRSRRPEVRRRAPWKGRLLAAAAGALVAGGFLAVGGLALSNYLATSPRFTLEQTETVASGEFINPQTVSQFFAADLGRSVYRTPLEERRRQLLSLPWVEAAYVMRGWPNRLRVLATERQPVAFVRLGPQGPAALSLIDREGVLLPLPARGNFQFPVVTGITESQPVAERRKRVRVLQAMVADLDSDTPAHSGEISEVDLSDATDAAVTASVTGAAIQVHLGNTNYLARYKYFLDNLDQWREQYRTVHTVDLRFEKQVIVQP